MRRNGERTFKQDNSEYRIRTSRKNGQGIALAGFDKASTRNIAADYIIIMSDLFSKDFQKEDATPAREAEKYMPVLNQPRITNEDRLYFLFSQTWMHLIAYPDSCRFFVQYYYSPYYPKYSAQEHLERWMPVLEQMKVLFKPETDVRASLRPVLNTMLSQAIKAASDTSTDKDSIARDNYALILGMLSASLLAE